MLQLFIIAFYRQKPFGKCRFEPFKFGISLAYILSIKIPAIIEREVRIQEMETNIKRDNHNNSTSHDYCSSDAGELTTC